MTGTGDQDRLLCWLAPMLGPTGAVPDVFEKLAPGLVDRGYPAVTASGAASGRRRVQEQVALVRRQGAAAAAVFVHVYGGRSFAIADLLSTLARRTGSPTVGYLSGGSLPDLARRHPRWVRRVLGRFDLLSAPSPYMARFVAELGLQAEVTPNPLDLAAFPYRRRPEPAPRLLWLRTFHAIYNPLLAIDVLEQVRRTHPEATLTMAGRDDGLQPEVEAAAARLGLSDAVTFPGFVAPAARLAALAGHDVFLHTNRIDNTPVSLLEAAASGLPIVGTAVGGVPDSFADGTEVLLAPDGDAAGLAAAVLRVLDEPGLGVALADAAYARVQAVDLPQVLDRWVERLTQLGVAPAPGP